MALKIWFYQCLYIEGYPVNDRNRAHLVIDDTCRKRKDEEINAADSSLDHCFNSPSDYQLNSKDEAGQRKYLFYLRMSIANDIFTGAGGALELTCSACKSIYRVTWQEVEEQYQRFLKTKAM